MRRRALLTLALAGSGCAARQPPAPPPPSRRATRRATPVTLEARLRQEAWLTRFWEELSPAQRARVQARLAGEEDADEAARAWDAMGLPQRATLVFGAR
jgi:hypothetical protein